MRQLLAWSVGLAWAGGTLGVAEAIYRDGPWLWAAAFYAVALGLAGLPLGALVARRRPAQGLAFMGFCLGGVGLSMLLGAFYTWRDVLQEAPGQKLWALAAAGGCGALFFAVTWALRWMMSRALTTLAAHAPVLLRARGVGLFCAAAWPACALTILCATALAPTESHPLTLGRAGAEATHAPRSRPSVVLVVVDALRFDAIGALAKSPSASSRTPNLDAFVGESLVFEQTSAQASWTRPAMASMLTGTLPSRHGCMHKNDQLPQTLPTLASHLQAHGVQTSAVVTNYNLAQTFGFDRGFEPFVYLPADCYLNAPTTAQRLSVYNGYRLLRERALKGLRQARFFYQPATVVNQVAAQVLASQEDKPAFMWLHYMDVHDPYVADDGTSFARVSDPAPTPADRPNIVRAYGDSVARFDKAFGGLVQTLQQTGFWSNTLVIVTSDHGEELGEHNGYYHGTSMYESLLHVPLLMRLPHGLGRRVPALARHMDLPATIDAYLGVPKAATDDGDDLLDDVSVHWALAEENHQGQVLQSMRWRDGQGLLQKVIFANDDNPRGLPPTEYFTLSRDPEEMSPLALPPDDASVALDQMQSALRHAQGVAPEPAHHAFDDADRAALRSLGYVQ